MITYLNMLKTILDTGTVRENRTGINTVGVNHFSIEYDLHLGQRLPIVTTKRVAFKSVLGELLGFIRGLDNAAGFRTLGCKVWDDSANKKGIDNDHPNQWLINPNRKGTDDLGKIYGVQWRRWEDTKIRIGTMDLTDQGYEYVAQFMKENRIHKVWTRTIDQLDMAVNALIKSPTNRRIIISAWNPGDMNEMALPPCHVLQHYICEELTPADRLEAHIVEFESRQIWTNNNMDGVRDKILKSFKDEKDIVEKESQHRILDKMGAPRYKVDLVMYQRSVDTILGAPFNIASYGMMIQMMARMTGHAPGSLYYATGDTHVYENHRDAAQEQLARTPITEPARFIINPKLKTLKDFERALPEDFRVFNYQNLGKLNNPTPMAV